LNQKIYQSHNLPPFIKDGSDFIWWCLNDLFFLCTYVLAHGKKREYKDLNEIHRECCDWLSWKSNPTLWKLLLMSRDSLKSTIGRAAMIQLLLNALVEGDEYLIGIICGEVGLSKEHIKIINLELLRNEMLQAYFADYLPKCKEDADEMSSERFRWRKVGMDHGSLKKSLSGRHYRAMWFDNYMNETNSTTAELRASCVDRFKSQGPLLRQDGLKLVSETPWEPDDLSGEILDPEHRFDYRTIHRKSPHIFISRTGYSVFSCGARNDRGEPNFPAIGGEKYLLDKRSDMGEYYFQRMYELLPISTSDYMFKKEWYKLCDVLPWNYIRMIAVDCAGTKNKDSSHSAITICDWNSDRKGYIAYAEKRKVSPKELFTWVCKTWDDSILNERFPTYILIEREKYGIYLQDDIEFSRPDIQVDTIPLRGVPKPVRMQELATAAEQERFLFSPGMAQMKDEWTTMYREKVKNTDLLDTLYLQLKGQLIPSKMERQTDEDFQLSEFERQARNDMMPNQDFSKYVNQHF